METAIICSIISAVASVVVAIVAAKLSAAQKQNEKDKEVEAQRAEQRHKEALLSMKLASANTELTVGVAMALKRGYANGEIEKGLEKVAEANKAYDDFLKELATNQLAS